jgi:glycosyltransferase involved in cell wall biosynthesis
MATDTLPEQPRFSIIVPAYNAETKLKECLDALLRQTVPSGEYEVIVVDDGSTDHTAAIAAEFPVRYLFQPNRGPASARNTGAWASLGSIILFTDSDCVPFSDWLEEMTCPFTNPVISAVKGAYRTRQRELVARFAQMEFEDRYDRLKKQEGIDMVDTYSAAFRKDIFLSMGGFDVRFPKADNEDTDFSYRMATAGYRMIFNPRALVWHTHPSTLWKYMRVKFSRGFWRLMVYRRFPGKAIRDSYTPNVLKIQSILMALSFVACLLSLVVPRLLWLAPAAWGGIWLSAIPLAVKTYQKDPLVGFLTPMFVGFRSVSLAAGSLSGLVNSLVRPIV